MIGYLPVANGIDVFVKGLTESGSINTANPYGTLILDAILMFSITDPEDNVIGGAVNIPMPLIDPLVAHYRGFTTDPGFVVGNYYQIQITSANYNFSIIQQFVAQNRPMLASPQFA